MESVYTSRVCCWFICRTNHCILTVMALLRKDNLIKHKFENKCILCRGRFIAPDQHKDHSAHETKGAGTPCRCSQVLDVAHAELDSCPWSNTCVATNVWSTTYRTRLLLPLHIVFDWNDWMLVSTYMCLGHADSINAIVPVLMGLLQSTRQSKTAKPFNMHILQTATEFLTIRCHQLAQIGASTDNRSHKAKHHSSKN